jgi:Uma2 family endonuclease
MVSLIPEMDRSKLTLGSSGWTCADLDRPEIDRQWHDQRIELIHGVVAAMPSPMFAHGEPLAKIARYVDVHFEEKGIHGRIGVGEVDLQVSPNTRFKADGMILLPEDLLRQERQQSMRRPHDHPRGVIIVPPTVVIESISRGHENHDRIEKFRAYAEFGVPYYWIVDAYRKVFDGWRLVEGRYETEFSLADKGVAHPMIFPGLELPLAKVFA